MDDEISELFQEVGAGNKARVAEVLRWKPELSRARDSSTLSVMQFARYMGHDTILNLLIDAGPPLNVFEAATIDRVERLRELLAGDPGLARAYSDDGFTALHFAAHFGSTSAMTALLDAGANIEAVTKNFLSNMPIHAAAAGGRFEACRLLLRRGADPDAKQHGGYTPLMTAAFANNRELAELFLAYNADFGARNDEGKTAADVAAGLGNMELAARLRIDQRHVVRDHLRGDSRG
jgi:ankyrin repeat protein